MPGRCRRPREQWLAVVAVLVVGMWGSVTWLIEPLWHRAHQLEERVSAKAMTLERLSGLMSRRHVINREHEAVSAYLAHEGPDASAALLKELEALAQRMQVRLDLKPRPARHTSEVEGVDVELTLQGTQGLLLSFLDALLRMPRLIEIARLQISGVPGTSGVLTARLLLQKYGDTLPISSWK